jgi:thioredoxin reductase (NADPH)
VVIRGNDLGAKMSRYLCDRIEAAGNIEVVTACEVTALHGDTHLEGIELTTRAGPQAVDCHGLFSFIGAVPSTDWLPDDVVRDANGFIRTDRDLVPGERPDGDALPFETSMPGVFAVGDVRVGSMKRVAAAVGEGSSAIRSVHDHLAGVTA